MVPNGGRSVDEATVELKGQTIHGKVQVGLESSVRYWASPQARDYKNPSSQDGERAQRKLAQEWTVDLNDQAAYWGTPTTRDWKDGSSQDMRPGREDGNGLLGQQVLRFRSSPTDPQIPDGKSCWCGLPNCAQRSHKRKLATSFGTWLMGLPLHWLAPEPTSFGLLETELYRFRLRSLLACLLTTYWRTSVTDSPAIKKERNKRECH